MDINQRAEALKEEGKTLFGEGNYDEAIKKYSQAIILQPENVQLYTNRALCAFKLHNYAIVEQDCERVLDLNRNSVKAHYLLGKVAVIRKDYKKGRKELQRAYDSAKEEGMAPQMAHDVMKSLYETRKFEWLEENTLRKANIASLTNKLKSFFDEYKKMKRFLEYDFEHIAPIAADDVKANILPPSNSDSECAVSGILSFLDNEIQICTIREREKAPDILCCKITMDIMKDPVITPAGITYERAAIVEHLAKVGKFDPTTRQPLQPHELIPNLGLRDVIQQYLQDHPWMFDE